MTVIESLERMRAQLRDIELQAESQMVSRLEAAKAAAETFDPLEIKNAYFNLERLGAIARRYTINQYGMSSSHLQGGLPTDRLVAEWWPSCRRGPSSAATRRPRASVSGWTR